ncbi:FAD-dependent monooxygenase [Acinetobacter sp. c2-A9]|uniref:FAD-dependent monooxygenase n=1 Tax=Acinetobacter sp. c2-A9 TaxID=3342802 RepID=UPI0035BB248D
MSQHDSNTKNHFPALIVGGGLVGGLTALLLAQAGVDVLVLDAGKAPQAEILEQRDPRVWALNAATLKLLQQAGIASHIQRQQPYSAMQVWNRDGFSELFFGQASEHVPMPQHWLGTMVEPSAVSFAVYQAFLDAKINCQYQAKVSRVERLPQAWQVELTDGSRYTTDLLIAADGANSFVRQQVGIQIERLDYQQTAISCAIRTEQPHQHTARQIFLPTGPLALLPMADVDDAQQGHWQSIVWTMPSDLAEQYMALPVAEFQQQLQKASHYMLGEISEITKPASFPLIARHAEHYVKDGLVLLGDAAHVIHPLAGQGVNIGCLDVAILVDALLNDKQRGAWANIQTLRRYEQARRPHNAMMMHSMSAIDFVHRSQWRPLQILRNTGQNFIAKQPKLVDFFNHQASGLDVLSKTRYA